MKEPSEDDHITFTLGRGNHSSICGGVAPMRVEGVTEEAKPHSGKPDEHPRAETQIPNSQAAE
jgi:hypothetical protein